MKSQNKVKKGLQWQEVTVSQWLASRLFIQEVLVSTPSDGGVREGIRPHLLLCYKLHESHCVAWGYSTTPLPPRPKEGVSRETGTGRAVKYCRNLKNFSEMCIIVCLNGEDVFVTCQTSTGGLSTDAESLWAAEHRISLWQACSNHPQTRPVSCQLGVRKHPASSYNDK